MCSLTCTVELPVCVSTRKTVNLNGAPRYLSSLDECLNNTDESC
jgi:hypothetical protein